MPEGQDRIVPADERGDRELWTLIGKARTVSDKRDSDQHHSYAYPMHRMVAIVDDEAGVQNALGDLGKIGIEPSDIDVLRGEEGARLLDPSGERHGVVGRLLRLAQLTAEEGNALEAHRQALTDGKLVVYVTAKGDEQKDRVATALAAAGGHHLAYFGRWTVEKEQG